MLLHLVTLLLAAPPAPCADARAHFESLEIDAAVRAADAALAVAPEAVACLEIRALALLSRGTEADLVEAEASLGRLFSRAPDHRFDDPRINPAMKDRIERVRRRSARVTAHGWARWLHPSALRLDLSLDGGVAGLTAVRGTAVGRPGGFRAAFQAPLRAGTLTATLAWVSPEPVSSLELEAVTLDADGGVHQPLALRVDVPTRPELRAATPAPGPADPPPDEGLGWGWWLGLGLAVAAAGATTAALVAGSGGVPTDGTLGRFEVAP